MSRTKRLRDAIDEYLESVEEANTNDILDHVNQRFRWGATMNQLGNVLAPMERLSNLFSHWANYRARSPIYQSWIR